MRVPLMKPFVPWFESWSRFAWSKECLIKKAGQFKKGGLEKALRGHIQKLGARDRCAVGISNFPKDSVAYGLARAAYRIDIFQTTNID